MSDSTAADLCDQELAACVKVLRLLARRPELCDGGDPRCAAVRDHAARLLRAAREQEKREGKQRDRELLDAAGIRVPSAASARGPEMTRGAPAVLSEPRRCYVCKVQYVLLHSFYDCLCPKCGDFNYHKRLQSAEMRGMVALVTGGRVKIGFQTVLKLLRAGASVEALTRFPRDAARRYAREDDFPVWRDRLRIHGLDLRDLPGVERFAVLLAERLGRLDVVVHNAAQTVRRPVAFYRHLIEGEWEGGEPLPTAAGGLLADLRSSEAPANAVLAGPRPAAWPLTLSLLGEERDDSAHFPPGWFDGDGQQIDLRPRNSWSLELGDVPPVELLEVHAVNCLAPFLLLRRLESLLFRDPHRPKYVVNVSAMEGQLNAAYKTGRHPHTNMAKAALNMLTRTSAGPYAERGVFMNSVDTGWITNEAPHPAAARMAAEGFREPLDVVDGAARVLDPIFVGLNTGLNEFGKFWKDYHPIPW